MRLQLTLAAALLLAARVAAGQGNPDPDRAPDPDWVTSEATAAPGQTAPTAPADTTPEPALDTSTPATGTGRVGVYTDSDHTTVWRALATLAKVWDRWSFSGSVGIDAVTSASIDVRSSPALSAVDTVTSASGRTSTSGGQMTDTRYQVTAGGGYKDGSGHAMNVTSAFATENDYASISGGVNGSYDVLDRTTTLLAGITLTDNWISSVIDPALHHKMFGTGWSAGVARVLTPDDAIRVRYDGKLQEGYIASPYRNVRFGNWTTSTNTTGGLVFANTIGSAAGLPEKLPDQRLAHALTLEWVHALARGVGLHPSLRAGHDDWGVSSLTPALELRVAQPGWRLLAGYRYYAQTRASFFATKYVMDPVMYANYTSDKELGRERGHLGELELDKVLADPATPHDTRMLLYLRVDVVRYSYPDDALLRSRLSAFFETGLSWEL